jgi:hypothetical protein
MDVTPTDQPTRFRLDVAIDPGVLAKPRCRPRYQPSFDRLEDRVLTAPTLPVVEPGRQSGTVATATAPRVLTQ